mmetsp:Transcript_50827/g.135655  ORF Transcript_50827/g.135655 Transcript_50827/m.135655 type:complete len:110 (+) Transcript_50827:1498-1827(+)
MTAMVVQPRSLDACEKLCTTLCDVVESRPLVGSSRKRRCGSATRAMPIETRFRCPPDTPRVLSSPMRVFLSTGSLKPSISTTLSTSSCTWAERDTGLASPTLQGKRNSA